MNKYLPRRDFLRHSAAIVGGAGLAGPETQSLSPVISNMVDEEQVREKLAVVRL